MPSIDPFSAKNPLLKPILDLFSEPPYVWGLRIHPPLGLALERVVPASGWQMPGGGPWLPGGTKVGMNAWVSNWDEAVFGPEDVDGFVPERWMKRPGETDDEWIERAARMKNLMFTFAHGSRVCTGKVKMVNWWGRLQDDIM
jgi:cytochrome P450